MMPEGTRQQVYTIPAGVPFVDALASVVLAEAGATPENLARYQILLPTRRAVRSLREAFLRLSGGTPLLLPHLAPLGDLDEDALAIAGWEELPGAGVADIPPAISGMRRQLLLTRLVQGFEGNRATPEQAARLAAELASLLDQVQTERLSFDRLVDLAPEEYAKHWQETLRFLRILTDQWPKVLAAENAIDPAERRNRLLEQQAAHWRDNPPTTPIIAAGSTGTVPATADLLSVVSGLPEGRVVLPGLDTSMDEAQRTALSEIHPQFGMMRLLEKLEQHPSEVQAWPANGMETGTPATRAQFVGDALRPAVTTDSWRDLTPPDAETLAGVSRIDFPTTEEEARAIAIMMRGALEIAGQTAALVTPDRGLARRVAAELGRWEIRIDDSAGEPLSRSAPGSYLRLVANAAAEQFAPVSLLALLKHPLALNGLSAAACRRLSRTLELRRLRGPRPGPGLETLLRSFSKDKDGELVGWLGRLIEIARPFAELLTEKSVAPVSLLTAHISFAEALAESDHLPGDGHIWAGEAGEMAAAFVSEMMASLDALAPLAPRDYPPLFEALMEGRAVRPRWGNHPRLFIWGLLEARLQHADVMILGGLNEGTWPPEAPADPWMSRPMRKDFGLPAPERRIGLTAHDFAQALGAPKVIMTRSERVDGTPSVASRWLVRIEKLLAGLDTGVHLAPEQPWATWQALIDKPADPDPVQRPAPTPPVACRPRQLYVTQIETWMRDPYAVYARHILGLRALDPLDAAPDAAEYGTIVHQALHEFMAAYPDQLPDDAAQLLLEIGNKQFAGNLEKPGVWAFWWPRFQRIADWFVAEERLRRPRTSMVWSEVEGHLEIDAPGGTFTVSARADRIDQLTSGSLSIVDYKTGAPPTATEVAAGYAPQLPLEAVIAAGGGFDGIAGASVAGLEYWRLRGTDPAGEIRQAGDDVDSLAAEAFKGLSALIAAFDRPDTPYEARPRPAHAPKYSDYEHLARVKEWAAADEGGGE